MAALAKPSWSRVIEALDHADLERLMDAAARAVSLDIPAECRAGVLANLQALMETGRSLIEPGEPPGPVVEIAPVYRP